MKKLISRPSVSSHPTRKINPALMGRILFGVALLGLTLDAHAQIITDGSMGAAGALSGPNFQIPQSLGQKVGRNLFHSFADFQLSAGESATFSGAANIHNILSRVTGGNPSLINGQINSTIPGANFFFINPAGTVFGPSAEINVGGSFVVTSADEIKLGSNGKFSAIDPSGTQLTSAAPQAFGFLTPNPAPIRFVGSQIFSSPDKSISVVGGNIRVRGGAFLASDGGLNLVSVGSPGEIGLDVDQPNAPITGGGFTNLGNIEVIEGSEVRGVGASGVTVRGGNMTVDNSTISVFGNGPGFQAPADVQVQGDLLLDHGGLIQSLNATSDGPPIAISADRIILDNGGQILSETDGPARGGDIDLLANQLLLSNGTNVSSVATDTGKGGALNINAGLVQVEGSGDFTGLATLTTGQGDAGTLTVNANDINLFKSVISTNSVGAGAGGDLNIQADNITVDSGGTFLAGIVSESKDSGRGGVVKIVAKNIQLLDGATLDADAISTGQGGSLFVTADTLEISGTSALSSVQAAAYGSGNAGELQIQAGTLKLTGLARVSTDSRGSGNAAPLTIKAQQILIDGQNMGASGISAESSQIGSGHGSDINITTDTLDMKGGALISTATESPNPGGNIQITAKNLTIDGNESLTGVIAGTTGSGQSGNISLNVDSLHMQGSADKALVSSASRGEGNGGNIDVVAKDILIEGNNSESGIVANAYDKGNGGKITIDTGSLQLLGTGEIASSAIGTGNVGGITIKADAIAFDTQNQASVGISSQSLGANSGNAGDIKIEANSLDMKHGAQVVTNTNGSGQGGSIQIAAKKLAMDGTGLITIIAAGTLGSGNSGNVTINADSLQIGGVGTQAVISSSSFGSGKGGNVNLTAKDILIDGRGSNSGIRAEALSTGDGGEINLKTDSLKILGIGGVSTSTIDSGNSGDIVIDAKSIVLDGVNQNAGNITSQSLTANAGHGGNIQLNTDSIQINRGGHINTTTASSNSGGNIEINAKELQIDATGSGTGITAGTVGKGDSGNITLNLDSLRMSGQGQTAVINSSSHSDGRGGDVTVNAKDVRIESQGTGSGINANANGKGNGGSITVNTDTLEILKSGFITASTTGAGNGGGVNINAHDITLNGDGTDFETGITSLSDIGATGDSGLIKIKTKNLTMLDTIAIDNSTSSLGNGAGIQIEAKNIVIDSQGDHDCGINASSTNLQDRNAKTGNSGSISIKTDNLTLKGRGTLQSATGGSGKGGDITISAKDFVINGIGKPSNDVNMSSETLGDSGNNTGGNIKIDTNTFSMKNGAIVSSSTFGGGKGGTVEVNVQNARIESQSAIGAVTFGAGSGGSISINAAKDFTIDGKGQRTGLTAGTFYTGANPDGDLGSGGEVNVHAGTLNVINGGRISTSSTQQDGSADLPTGAGGKLNITAGEMLVDKGTLDSQASGTGDAGEATINVSGRLTLRDSNITAAAQKTNGGSLNFNIGRGFFAQRSEVTAFAFKDGGNVTIAPLPGSNLRYIILDRSNVKANAIQGKGGNILLRSRIFLPSAESIVDASSQFGITGNVNIDSPNTNVGGSLVTLPSNLLGAENYLNERCEVRLTGVTSSFTINPQNGVPVQPGDLLPSPPAK